MSEDQFGQVVARAVDFRWIKKWVVVATGYIVCPCGIVLGLLEQIVKIIEPFWGGEKPRSAFMVGKRGPDSFRPRRFEIAGDGRFIDDDQAIFSAAAAIGADVPKIERG